MTTSYERLREECNKRLPERYADERISITDVLRVLAATHPEATSFYIEDDGNLWQCAAPLADNLLCTFNLSLPLSAPENEAACEAVLDLLTNN